MICHLEESLDRLEELTLTEASNPEEAMPPFPCETVLHEVFEWTRPKPGLGNARANARYGKPHYNLRQEIFPPLNKETILL